MTRAGERGVTEELRALLAAATKGPVTVTDVGDVGRIGPRWSVEGPKEGVTEKKPYTSWPVLAQFHLEPDARLIVAAINALPDLLEVVDAARDARNCIDHASNCCADWCGNCQRSVAAQLQLDDALAKLDASAAGDAGGK